MGGYIAIGVLVVLILILVVSCIHVVQQSKAYVVERLGSFSAVWGNGLHWKWPTASSWSTVSTAAPLPWA